MANPVLPLREIKLGTEDVVAEARAAHPLPKRSHKRRWQSELGNPSNGNIAKKKRAAHVNEEVVEAKHLAISAAPMQYQQAPEYALPQGVALTNSSVICKPDLLINLESKPHSSDLAEPRNLTLAQAATMLAFNDISRHHVFQSIVPLPFSYSNRSYCRLESSAQPCNNSPLATTVDTMYSTSRTIPPTAIMASLFASREVSRLHSCPENVDLTQLNFQHSFVTSLSHQLPTSTTITALRDAYILPRQPQRHLMAELLAQKRRRQYLDERALTSSRLLDIQRASEEATITHFDERPTENSWLPAFPISTDPVGHNPFIQCLAGTNRLLSQNPSAPSKNQDEAAESGVILSCSADRGMLNDYLTFLRKQIEFFRATVLDIMSYTRGRNNAIALRQVGIRCRHCSHIPPGSRCKGSTYFPSTLMGIYQAAQNISVEHLQSGLCPRMPNEVKETLLTTRAAKSASSGAGKAYWAYSAEKLGLVDTDDGIRFEADVNHSPLIPTTDFSLYK